MISKITFTRSPGWITLYEGDDDDAAAKAAAAAAKKAADDAAAAKVTSQEELNKVLKREKEKFRKEREKLIAQMEELKGSSKGMSEDERNAFEAQIEELRNANLTVEEQARRQKEKLDKEWADKFKSKETEAADWQSRHNSLQVGYEIGKSANEHKVLPSNVQFVDAFLRPRTRLVENVDAETGKPNGTFTPKVKMPSKDKEGKAIELDLPINDAVKLMKETPDQYGTLFEGQAVGGLGGNTGQPGKKPNIKAMAQDPELYMKARKENPASVGL